MGLLGDNNILKTEGAVIRFMNYNNIVLNHQPFRKEVGEYIFGLLQVIH